MNSLIKNTVEQKLHDAETPTRVVEFTHAEADFAGAFVEDALNESDALDSAIDRVVDFMQEV